MVDFWGLEPQTRTREYLFSRWECVVCITEYWLFFFRGERSENGSSGLLGIVLCCTHFDFQFHSVTSKVYLSLFSRIYESCLYVCVCVWICPAAKDFLRLWGSKVRCPTSAMHSLHAFFLLPLLQALATAIFFVFLWLVVCVGLGGVMVYFIQARIFCDQRDTNSSSSSGGFPYVDTGTASSALGRMFWKYS